MVTVDTEKKPLKKCRAIVRFGPETPTSGMRPSEYYQVTIDPNMVSPDAKFIRFGQHDYDEIVGWQRIDAITVCEVLAETPDVVPHKVSDYSDIVEFVVMNCVINKD